jgi:exonuclease SbcD
MKFFHIADLHLGKMLYHVSLTETDQAFWVERFLEAVDRHQPDAVVIAGDIYDRRIPPVEAVRLFDHLVTELARRGKYVFVIPGNHDSAVRVAHVNELLVSHHLYIAGELERELMHVTVPGGVLSPAGEGVLQGNEYGDGEFQGDASGEGQIEGNAPDVTFWLLPYIFPKAVADSRVCGREDLSSYDEAARLLLSQQQIDTSSCNVLVAHQNVLAGGVKPQHSDSETIIGGIGEIEYTAFDAFDYVALGHIHHAQKVGRETVRYAGCPLYYDFSELGRCKDLTMVTIRSKDDIAIERIPITLRHQILQKTGTLSELLEEGAALRNKESYYIQCILQDAHIPPRALEQLREV